MRIFQIHNESGPAAYLYVPGDHVARMQMHRGELPYAIELENDFQGLGVLGVVQPADPSAACDIHTY